jgi:hypothetical protein
MVLIRGKNVVVCVLVLAMVLIFLLYWFVYLPEYKKANTFSDLQVMMAQGDAYWRYDAKPFAILEHSQSNGRLALLVQNVELDRRTLAAVSVGNKEGTGEINNISMPFAGGEKEPIYIQLNGKCKAGNIYKLDVNFTYNAENAKEQVEIGNMSLVGKCR